MSGQMTFLELVQSRCSVRKFQKKRIEREKMERCLEAARMAPSACNSQPWYFIVVDDPDLVQRIAAETYDSLVRFNKFVHQAAALVIVLSEKSNVTAQIGAALKKRAFNLIDMGIAVEHFCLQAVEEGLGTCMLGWFNEKNIRKILNIQRRKRIGLVIAVGYPAPGEMKPKQRKSLAEIREYLPREPMPMHAFTGKIAK